MGTCVSSRWLSTLPTRSAAQTGTLHSTQDRCESPAPEVRSCRLVQSGSHYRSPAGARSQGLGLRRWGK